MVHLLCICSLPLWCIEHRTCDTGVRLQIEFAALQSLVSPASCSPDTKKTAYNQQNEWKKNFTVTKYNTTTTEFYEKC